MATIPQALALALEHQQAGRLQAAEEIYRQVLQADPRNSNALHLRGLLAYQMGQYQQAADSLQQALLLNPNQAALACNLATVYRVLHRWDEAIACCRHALQLRPDFPEAHNNLGIALAEQGREDEAAACCREALRLRPDYAEGHYNLGIILKRQGHLAEAADSYRRALDAKPDYAEAHNNLGIALAEQGRVDEAVACYREALRLRPDSAEAHNSLGVVLQCQRRLAEALACYREALRLRPDYAEGHNNLGNLLQGQGQLVEALACYQEALRLRPDYAEAHNNTGWVLQNLGRLEEALASFDRALNLQPDQSEASFNRAVTLLKAGDIEGGWAPFWALARERYGRRFNQPRWDGSPLTGRTILLHLPLEWGLGDMLQCVRYASWVKQQGAGRVILECQVALLPLLARCLGVDQVVAQGSPLPPHHVELMLNLLPPIFWPFGPIAPAEPPYVCSDAIPTRQWRHELTAERSFKIGLHWQGNPLFGMDRLRSLLLAEFAPLADLEKVRLFSLQPEMGAEQLAAVAFPLVDLGCRFESFADTAAVLVNLDLVVCVDSAVAHCAGALGVPVWLILPFSPDWRWLQQREDSPWYPSMRLFRQTKVGDWDGVFERIVTEVRAVTCGSGANS